MTAMQNPLSMFDVKGDVALINDMSPETFQPLWTQM